MTCVVLCHTPTLPRGRCCCCVQIQRFQFLPALPSTPRSRRSSTSSQIVVRNTTPFLCHLNLKLIILPRQARDDHSESFETNTACCTGYSKVYPEVFAGGNCACGHGEDAFAQPGESVLAQAMESVIGDCGAYPDMTVKHVIHYSSLCLHSRSKFRPN